MAVQEAVAQKWKQVTGYAADRGVRADRDVAGRDDQSARPACLQRVDRIADLVDRARAARRCRQRRGARPARRDLHPRAAGDGRLLAAPDETAKVIDKDGWFATGDIGVMDERGFVKIVDRKKDMILVSGFNVYPNEIEGVHGRAPGRARMRGDRRAGREVRRSGQALRRQEGSRAYRGGRARSTASENLTGYKCPRDIEFRTELPKSNVGKILRRELRDEAKKKQAA